MKSEKDLIKRFNQIIDELPDLSEKYKDADFNSDLRPGEFEAAKKEFEAKLEELREISIQKIKLKKEIDNILNTVRPKIEQLLENISFSKTEEEINEILMNIRRFTDNKELVIRLCKKLRQLSISEEDLVETNKKIARTVEKFMEVVEEEFK